MPRLLLLAFALILLAPAAALGAVQPKQPFPSNLFTTLDVRQATLLRVDLPKPNCDDRPSDCADIDVLNTLDGFNVDARLSIPFSGPIDPATVSSDSVFLVDPHGRRTGIERVVWTPATNTLHAQPAVYLDQHTPYLLVVTDDVKAADGSELDASKFRRDLNFGHARDLKTTLYRAALLTALHWARVPLGHIVTASLFTTQSVTPLLEKVRRQLDAATPAPANFAIAEDGSRTVFPFATVLGVRFNRQVGTSTFAASTLPAAIPIFPGAIGTVAFGKYASPDYETPAKVIPAVGTRTGTPAPQATTDIYFNLYLPSGPKPASGWPVAIFGHGFTDSKQGAPITVASTMAQHGIATIAINVVGHGGGPLGTLTVLPAGVTFPAGGRGIDQDGDGDIESTEGSSAAPPATLVSSRDGLRQTVIDLMQLVREIQVGMDVDGLPGADLDPSRISYFGQSFGGIYGSIFMAVEPDVHAGVLNVPGGSITEIARLSPSFRGLVGLALASRSPTLYNNPAPDPRLTNFNEDLPFNGQPPLVDTVAGADAIQNWIDTAIWAQAAGDPVAYASHIRADPVSGAAPKAVVVQFAKGDMTVPNPTASALIRAGALEDRATYFRNDLALQLVPGYAVRNPHTFLTSVTSPTAAGFAVAAQQQIATFLESNGATTIDPDGAGPFFETPIVGPLPETLNFAP